jgi:hypothetical protein
VGFLSALQSLPVPFWSLLAAIICSFVSWLIAMRRASVTLERERMHAQAHTLASENVERAAFRSALMTEIGKVREEIKDCEAAREALRGRVNALEEQLIVLRATNEIMQRWLVFFKQREGGPAAILPNEPAV